MKRHIQLIAFTSACLLANNIAIAGSNQTGTMKLEIPVTTTITPINNTDLNFGNLTQTTLETAQTKTTPVSIYSNSGSPEDLCLETSFSKYNSAQNLPELSLGIGGLESILLEKVSYRVCGGAGSPTKELQGSQQNRVSLTAADGGTTEDDCTGATGVPGELSITTKPISSTAAPLAGGVYSSTITLGVGAGGC